MIPASVWVYTPPVSPRFGRPVVVVTDGTNYTIGRMIRNEEGSTIGILWDAREVGGPTSKALIAHAEQMDQLRFNLTVPPTDLVLDVPESAELDEKAKIKPLLTDRVLKAIGAK